MQASHLGDLGLEDAHLRAEPIAFGAHGLQLGLLGLSGSQLQPEPFRFHLLVSEPVILAFFPKAFTSG